MTQPFLSIVTISYNQVDFLRQCVESVLSQKSDDVEYIVVDAGSSDGSREILAEYGNAIDCLISEADGGPADGLNKGFARANGQFGYFINSDDFLLPGAIERLRELWEIHSHVDLLLGGAWMVDRAGRPLRELKPTTVSLPSLLAGRSVIVQQGFSFRLKNFRSTRFNKSNRICWDFEFLCDLLYKGANAVVCDVRIGVFRYYDMSLSGGVNSGTHAALFAGERNRIYEKFAERSEGRRIRAPHAIARLSKYFRAPKLGFHRLREVVFPGTILARWNSDWKSID